MFFVKYDLKAEVEWKEFPKKKLHRPVFQIKRFIKLWDNDNKEDKINVVELATVIRLIKLSLKSDW